MAIKHHTIPPAGTSNAIDQPQWAEGHDVDSGGITFNDTSVQTTAWAGPVILGATGAASNIGAWGNTTMGSRMQGPLLLNYAQGWKFLFDILDTGNLVIGNAAVRRAAKGSATYIDSTPITWGGNNTPTFSGGAQTVTSDRISIALDPQHDYYMLMYFTAATSAGLHLAQYTASSSTIVGGYQTGDQTAAATFAGYTGFASASFIYNVVAA